MIHFLSAGWRLLEVDQTEASASLTAACQEQLGFKPNFDQTSGDATTGMYLPSSSSDEAQVIIQRKANGRAVGRALWLLSTRHDLVAGIRLVRSAETATTIRDDNWQPNLQQRPYDPGAVSVWPEEPAWPIRDRVVIEYADSPGLFVHRLRRDSRCDWCIPASTAADALTFASAARARAWVEKRASTERHPLVLRYRSVALALIDQSDAEASEETDG